MIPLRPLSLCLALALGACRRDAGGEARESLHEAGFHYTVTEFHRAAREGRRDAVAHFIDSGMNPAVSGPGGMTALGEAALHGHGHVVELLLSHKVPVLPSNLTAAVRGGDTSAVEALRKAGATEAGILELAATLGHTHLIARLTDTEPATDLALIAAATHGHTDTVAALLDAGASPLARDAKGRTALMAAAAGGHRETATWLASHGSSLTATDGEGRCAADLAALFPAVQAALIRPAQADQYPDLPARLESLDDLNIHTLSDQMEMVEFGPARLPVALLAVSEGRALLHVEGQEDDLSLLPGEPVDDTGLVLQSVQAAAFSLPSGPVIDVSRATFTSTNGGTLLLILGLPATTSEPQAILRHKDTGALFTVIPGQTFAAGAAAVQVVGIRPSGVALKSDAWTGSIIPPK